MGTAEQNTDAQAIKQKLIEVIKPFISPEVDVTKIEDSSDLIVDLKINSTRFVDIILEMEDKFDVTIDDKTADNMLTFGDAVNAILKQKTA